MRTLRRVALSVARRALRRRARLAVLAGMTKEEFVQAEFARLLIVYSRLCRLGAELDAAGNVRAVRPDVAMPDVDGAPPWLRSQLRALDGVPGAAACVRRLSALYASTSTATRRDGELELQLHETEDRIVTAASSAVANRWGSAERHALRSGRLGCVGSDLLIAICLVVEAVAMSPVTLDLVGIDASRLPHELERDPAAVVMGGALAATAAFSVFALVHALVSHTLRVHETSPPALRKTLDWLFVPALAAFVVVVLVGVVAGRATALPGSSVVAGIDGAGRMMAILTVAMPAAAGVLLGIRRTLIGRIGERLAARDRARAAHAEETSSGLDRRRRTIRRLRRGMLAAAFGRAAGRALLEAWIFLLELSRRVGRVLDDVAIRRASAFLDIARVEFRVASRSAIHATPGPLVSPVPSKGAAVPPASIARRAPAWTMLAVLSCVGLSSAAFGSTAEDESPIHLEVVSAESSAAPDRSAATERRAACLDWADQTVRRTKPGSSFTLHVLHADGTAAANALRVCVPDAWPAPVRRRKEAFIEDACRLAEEPSTTTPTFGSGCNPDATTRRARVQLIGGEAYGRIYVRLAQAPDEPGTSTAAALICDQSASGIDMTCTAANALRAFDLWAEQSRGAAGSSFGVYVPGTSLATSRRIARYAVAAPTPGERLLRLLADRQAVARLPRSDTFGSAVAECLYRASSDLAEAGDPSGRKLLFILSDLRQQSALLRPFPPQRAQDFRDAIRREHLAPSLQDVSVVACGLHVEASPGVDGGLTGAAAHAIRDAWSDAFQEFGAPNVRIYASCEDGLRDLGQSS